ncbi:erythroferrone [Corythoichthys intestinalis]|uniref:erythroferrone n=1 Tax=Corythoichthys intestinalis TaxID=161448 RepID=UPI0025A66FF3|nr:erythroferrone [Corythoichthys intestinalis]
MRVRTMKMAVAAMLLMMLSGVREALPVQDDVTSQGSTTRRSSVPSPRTSWLMLSENARAGYSRSTKGPPRPRGLRRHPQQLLDMPRTTAGASQGVLCAHGPPRVSASFMGRLRRPVEVGHHSRVELRPFAQGSPLFQRGHGFDNYDGRYVATLGGFYLLGARLRLQSVDSDEGPLDGNVRAGICLKSLCNSNSSIESVGVAGVGGTFSISLSGALFLQAGEYASVYVDNSSSSSVRVMPDSFFSAILLGI